MFPTKKKFIRTNERNFFFLGELLFGSEMKCIEQLCESVHIFPPGCCATIPINLPTQLISIVQYYVIPTIADRFISMENIQVSFFFDISSIFF